MSLLIKPLLPDNAVAERSALARKVILMSTTGNSAKKLADDADGADANKTNNTCQCAAVRVSNVENELVSFKVQTSQELSHHFNVSPQTGTMKPTSSVVIAIAYCGEDTMSITELSHLKFQLCSWSPDHPTGSKTKTKFSLQFQMIDFDESVAGVSKEHPPTTLDANLKEKDRTERTERQERQEKRQVTPATRAKQDDNHKLRQRRRNVQQTPQEKKEDPMHGWPPWEKEQAAANLKSSMTQENLNDTVTSTSVTRLQNNAATVASKCTNICMQLLLFACLLYMYIFSYPGMTGTVVDVMSMKTAVLPSFLLGVLGEKIRRRCL